MVQPIFNDTDFAALPVHVFDIVVTVFDAGTFTAHLDGGPYTGSDATITLIRDALLSDINGGTHVGWTAATESTDSIRITATGPGQHIGGGPGEFNPRVQAPGSGAISIVDVTPVAGINLESLVQEIEADVAIPTKLVPRPAEKVVWVDVESSPRTIQMNFVVDPLPGAEKTALDLLVSLYTNVDTAGIVRQLIRTTNQADAESGVIVAANLVLASKGPPDGGIKLVPLDGERHFAKSDALSNTALSAYQTKITQNFVVDGGTYEVKVCGLIWNTMNKPIDVKFTVDGTIISEHHHVSSEADAEGSWNVFDERALTSGSKTFIVEFKAPMGGSAEIQDVRMSAFRIGD